ncbi:unnamed protein product [Prunus armeniaca]|uniref:Uncharacterized protein n=1 Tax=Prunus armeniaca TaxID=36596 RepID=A0A6J5XKV4_PRUAR|nr:unnamed protein product [Prunus armeniaca]
MQDVECVSCTIWARRNGWDRVVLGNESGRLHILLLVLQNISAQLQFPSPMTMSFSSFLAALFSFK